MPMRPQRMTIRLAVVAVLLSGCAAVTEPSLDGTEWLSTAVTEDGADRPLVDGTRIRLSFTDGQLGASAGCNTMGGEYRIDAGRLVFEGGGMTEMGCDEERHAQDDWLLGFLGSQPAAVWEGDKLTLTSGAVVIALQDAEVAEPDLPLTDTTWTVDTILGGDAASSVPDDAVASLVFTDDGHVEIETGCATGRASFEATATTLHITDILLTQGTCGVTGSELESAVEPLLGAEELEYVIDAGALTLMAGDQGLVLRGD
jgi:heat shock protein HslJ